MAMLSRVTRGTAIAMVLLPTTLVAWLPAGETLGSRNEDTSEANFDEVSAEDVFFEIVHPVEIGYTYRIRPAHDFGAAFDSSFSGQGIRLVPVEPPTGCEKLDNAYELRNSIALVWRGDCSYYQKAVIAEEAGAKAIIVTDYVAPSIDVEREKPYWNDYAYVEMASDNEISLTRNVTIPAGFMLGKNGKIIKATLRRLDLRHAIINIPVNLTLAPLEKFHQPPWVAL